MLRVYFVLSPGAVSLGCRLGSGTCTSALGLLRDCIVFMIGLALLDCRRGLVACRNPLGLILVVIRKCLMRVNSCDLTALSPAPHFKDSCGQSSLCTRWLSKLVHTCPFIVMMRGVESLPMFFVASSPVPTILWAAADLSNLGSRWAPQLSAVMPIHCLDVWTYTYCFMHFEVPLRHLLPGEIEMA